MSCFLNQFLIFCSIQKEVVRAYVCSDMGLSIWPVRTTCFSFSRFLFSFRPSCVSVHVSCMDHKHFFPSYHSSLSVPIWDLWNIPLQIVPLFHLFIFLFSFRPASSDIFISVWNLTIYHNHVWPMKGPESGKQALMDLLVRQSDARNHIWCYLISACCLVVQRFSGFFGSIPLDSM
jgi:hypothetical protein